MSPSRALLVGDSLASDMACARNAGVDGCWYNPGHKPRPADMPLAWEIDDLAQLKDILEGTFPKI